MRSWSSWKGIDSQHIRSHFVIPIRVCIILGVKTKKEYSWNSKVLFDLSNCNDSVWTIVEENRAKFISCIIFYLSSMWMIVTKENIGLRLLLLTSCHKQITYYTKWLLMYFREKISNYWIIETRLSNSRSRSRWYAYFTWTNKRK